jgi:uncharacterized protein (TIGR02147 family)
MLEKVGRYKLTQNDIADLAMSDTYRNFIKKAVLIKSTKPAKYSYSDLARFAGFSSRSFPRDVVLGKKRITLVSINKFITGLGLTGDLAQYFIYLVEIEHEDCRSKKKLTIQIEKCIINLRQRLIRQTPTSNKAKAKQAECFKNFNIPQVYAALGNIATGATFAEIAQRTNFDTRTIKTALKDLEVLDIVKQTNGRYTTLENHLDLTGLGTSLITKDFYLGLLDRARDSANKNFNAENELHFFSTFSVNKDQLPDLKKELKTILLNYVDQQESTDGKKIVILVCSLF